MAKPKKEASKLLEAARVAFGAMVGADVGTKPKPKPKFDPENGSNKNGTDYDYASAESAGMKRAANGHMGTRNPKTGQILKSRGHKTWDLGVQGETEAGYEMYKNSQDGKYYSRPASTKKADNSAFLSKNKPKKKGK